MLWKKKNMENQEKIEENYKKFLEKQKHMKELENNKDLKREKAMKEIEDKNERIEKFKEEQQLISERKKQVRDEIVRKKEEYDNKFQKMFHKKNIDDKMIRNIQKMFPGNTRINILLNRLQELEEEEKNEILKAEKKGKEIDDNLKKSQNEFRQTLSTSNRTTRTNYKNKTLSSRPNDNNVNNINIINTTEENNNEQIINTDDNNNNEESDNNKLKSNNNNYFTFGIKKEEQKKKSTPKEKKGNYKNPKNEINASPIGNNLKNSNKKEYNHKKNFNNGSSNVIHTNNSNNNNNNNQTNRTVPNKRINNIYVDNKEEKKIEKKLNDYKVELSNQLLQFITEEKKKEAERIDYYNNAKDPNERANLMKKLGEERTKSAMLILKMNEEMAQKYNEYEKSLRKN